MITKHHIESVAAVLAAYATAKNAADWKSVSIETASDSSARVYANLLEDMSPESDVPRGLQGADFAPFLMRNGLSLAAGQSRYAERAFTLGVLSLGLTEFAAYFLAVANRFAERPPDGLPDGETLQAQQRRYFAFCLAQLSEAGMSMDGILMTMKGDSLDQGTSYAVRNMLEDGPEAAASSPLWTDEEKKLWARIDEPGAFASLQEHFVAVYRLPFKKAPPAEDGPQSEGPKPVVVQDLSVIEMSSLAPGLRRYQHDAQDQTARAQGEPLTADSFPRLQVLLGSGISSICYVSIHAELADGERIYYGINEEHAGKLARALAGRALTFFELAMSIWIKGSLNVFLNEARKSPAQISEVSVDYLTGDEFTIDQGAAFAELCHLWGARSFRARNNEYLDGAVDTFLDELRRLKNKKLSEIQFLPHADDARGPVPLFQDRVEAYLKGRS